MSSGVSTGYKDNSYWVNQDGESSDSEASPSQTEFKTLVHQFVPDDKGAEPAAGHKPGDGEHKADGEHKPDGSMTE